jgi:hypothetical protein
LRKLAGAIAGAMLGAQNRTVPSLIRAGCSATVSRSSAYIELVGDRRIEAVDLADIVARHVTLKKLPRK